MKAMGTVNITSTGANMDKSTVIIWMLPGAVVLAASPFLRQCTARIKGEAPRTDCILKRSLIV